MSLLDRDALRVTTSPAASPSTDPRSSSSAGSGSANVPLPRDGEHPTAQALYLLVFNDPDAPSAGYGLGWTLTAYQGSARCWSVALAAHGAGTGTDRGRAEHAAETVLAERGVLVLAWHHGASADAVIVRAQPHPAPAGTAPDARWWGNGCDWLG